MISVLYVRPVLNEFLSDEKNRKGVIMETVTTESSANTESSKELQLQRRLKFIDFLLYFRGWFTRLDLTEEFKIASTGASRDIAAYKQNETALKLNDKTKRYEASETFTPSYPLSFNNAVNMLKKQSKKGLLGASDAIPFEYPEKLSNPSVDILAAISRAIGSKTVADVEYSSMTSQGERSISPHALFSVGEKIYVRAYCHRNKEFRNFSIGRFAKAVPTTISQPKEAMQHEDDQWQRKVNLKLAPHQSLGSKEQHTIQLEFGMTNEQNYKEVKVRAAICGFWLEYWKVDCSSNRSIGNPEKYPLMLVNLEALYDVESAKFAPGVLGLG